MCAIDGSGATCVYRNTPLSAGVQVTLAARIDTHESGEIERLLMWHVSWSCGIRATVKLRQS